MGLIAQLLALVALVPAAANPALLAGDSLTLSLCEGGTITVPVGGQIPGGEGKACCNKGCHAGDKRKRSGDERSDRTGEPDAP